MEPSFVKRESDSPSLIDSHAHMDMRQFKQDLEAVSQSALEAGVKKILTVALSIPGAYQTLDLCRRYPDLFRAALGFHPHDAHTVTDSNLREMSDILATQPSFVALGEIGLDYYRDLSPRPDQEKIFREQLRLARQLQLPVIIHCRDAYADTLSILREEKADQIGGVMHCFSGDETFARNCLDLNLYLSLAGPLTYKNAAHLREIARETPLTRILVETDCPYLAPEPYRGKRNEPAYVAAVAHKLAEIKGIPFPEVKAQISSNFDQLFWRKSV